MILISHSRTCRRRIGDRDRPRPAPSRTQFISGRRRKTVRTAPAGRTRAAPIAGSMVSGQRRPRSEPRGIRSRPAWLRARKALAEGSSQGAAAGLPPSVGAPSLLVPYGIARLQAAHRFPGALCGSRRSARVGYDFVPNAVEIGKHACAPGLEPNDMPAILGLKHFPLSQRQRQKRIA